MKKSEFRIFIAVIALILVFSTLFGAYKLYGNFGIKQPLRNQIENITEIKNTSINKNKDHYVIKINLKKVDNIQEKYREIEEVINLKFDKKEYELVIGDRRSPELKAIFNELQPAIYEAISTNKYVWLKEYMQSNESLKGLDYNIFIDDDKLYIQVFDGDYYLYEVVNRQIPGSLRQ